MEKKNFHVTAPLTIIALIVIIALGVFLVFAITQKDSPNTSTVNTVIQDTETGVPDEIGDDIGTPTTSDTEADEDEEATTEKLATFSDDVGGITFKYPSAWKTEVSHTDAPANRPGRKIDTIITLTVDSGDSYSVSIPAPEIGFEAWTFGDPKTITAADGKVFARRTGVKTDSDSTVKNNFYYAFTPDESTDSVMVMGGADTLPQSLIDQLDALIATIAVQE